MEEIIVEGLDYEDFKTLKEILCNNTTFKFVDFDINVFKAKPYSLPVKL